MLDFVGDARPRAGEVRLDCEKDWICSVKSSSKLVVSFSLYDGRGVGDGDGDGVRSERRTVEGVICARARGVAFRACQWCVCASGGSDSSRYSHLPSHL